MRLRDLVQGGRTNGSRDAFLAVGDDGKNDP
jgi:hypothetical protein